MSMLEIHGLTHVVTEKNPPPRYLGNTETSNTPNPEYDKFVHTSRFVLGWIKATVTAEVQPHVNPCQTAPDAWDLLAKEFGVASTIHIQKLQEELHDLSLDPGMSIQDYILRAKTLSHSLAIAGEIVSTQTLRSRILGELGHQYKEFITTQNSKGDTTIEDLKDLLLQEEALQKKFSNHTQANISALTATKMTRPSNNFSSFANTNNVRAGGQRGRGNGRHNGRGRFRGRGILPHPMLPFTPSSVSNRHSQSQGRSSHSNANVSYTPPNPFVSQDPNMVICQICNKAGHTATTCYQRGTFAYNAQYYPGSSGHLGNGGGTLNENSSPMALVSFVLDSGATNHMTSNPDVLQQHSIFRTIAPR